jgi:hypothetical protein
MTLEVCSNEAAKLTNICSLYGVNDEGSWRDYGTYPLLDFNVRAVNQRIHPFCDTLHCGLDSWQLIFVPPLREFRCPEAKNLDGSLNVNGGCFRR